MFGRIARWYDFLNHALSLGQDIYWRYRLVRLVRPAPGTAPGRPWRVLDLAAGTLDVTLEILRRHPEARVTAADFSFPMLARGQAKIPAERRARVASVLADGRELPLRDGLFDAVTIAFGIRNIIPRQAAYAEIRRVLKPGGRFLILEFGSGRQRIWRGLYNFYLERLLPCLGRLASGDSEAYGYLARTIAEFPTAEELAEELRQAGFERTFHQPLLSGIVNIHVAEKPLA